MLNWTILILGLLGISFFWHIISPAERKRETRIVSIIFIVLGIVVYFLQSTFIS